MKIFDADNLKSAACLWLVVSLACPPPAKAALPKDSLPLKAEKFQFTSQLGYVVVDPSGEVLCGSKGPKKCNGDVAAVAEKNLATSIKPAQAAFLPGVGLLFAGAAACTIVGAVNGAAYAYLKGPGDAPTGLELVAGSAGLGSVGGAAAITGG